MQMLEQPAGLKKFTKPKSVPVRLAKGGKQFERDNSKARKYKVSGEK